MQAQVTLHTSPHGSLCSSPLPGSHDSGTTSLGAHTACLRLLQHHIGLYCHRLTLHSLPRPLPGLSEPEPPNQLQLNPVLSEQRIDALRQPKCRGWAKSKAERQELCQQRKKREISPSSLRSSVLNPTINLMYPAPLEYLKRQRIIPKLREWTLCDFVCIALLLPFVLGFHLSIYLFIFLI